MGLFQNLMDDKTVAMTALAGVALGGIGGFMAGPALGLGEVMAGVLFSVVGLAAGAYAGHAISESNDRATPAPLGMRPKSGPKAEPGKAAEVSFEPSVPLADSLKATVATKFKDHPQKDEVAKYMPLMKVARYASVTMNGDTSADGATLTVTKVSMSGGPKAAEFAPKGIVLKLKDGRVDENNPDNKAQMLNMMDQGVDALIEPKFRALAKDIIKDSFEKMPVPKVVPEAAADAPVPAAATGIGSTIQDVLQSAPAKAVVAALKPDSMGGTPGSLPYMPPTPPGGRTI